LFSRFAIITATARAMTAVAESSAQGLNAHAVSLTDNIIKAFDYDWYARFDNGASIDGFVPN